jgi:hypothetical protein
MASGRHSSFRAKTLLARSSLAVTLATGKWDIDTLDRIPASVFRFTQKSVSVSPASFRAETTSRSGTPGISGMRALPSWTLWLSTSVRVSTGVWMSAFEYIRNAQ